MLICSQATILKIYHTFSVQFVEKKKEKNVSENVNKFFLEKTFSIAENETVS